MQAYQRLTDAAIQGRRSAEPTRASEISSRGRDAGQDSRTKPPALSSEAETGGRRNVAMTFYDSILAFQD